MTPLALRYMGDGEFRALRPAQADKQLVIGEVLRWEQVADRTPQTHKHYFACIAEAWKNLPEAIAEELPSPEHLRKWALVKAGYGKKADVVCANNAAALTLVATARMMDEYAVIDINGKVVTIWRAASQNGRAMDKKAFQESKEKVLDVISKLIGTDAATLERQAA